jgi:ABC-type thiamin/hydroxymethylpyrimidine transport system permease subunit
VSRKFLSSFSVFDIIMIAMCAGLGIAVKVVARDLVQIITMPLFIPGGAVAGGIYFLFIVAAAGLVNKPGAATLACVVQAVLAIMTATGHGVLSLLTFTVPGIVIDLFYILTRRKINAVTCFLMGALANIAGTYGSNLAFFRLPLPPLMLSLLLGALSGGLGGLAALAVIKGLRKLNPVFEKKAEVSVEK